MPRSSKSLPCRFSSQNIVCISHLSHSCCMLCPSHLLWFDHPNNIWWSVQIMKLFIMQLNICSVRENQLCTHWVKNGMGAWAHEGKNFIIPARTREISNWQNWADKLSRLFFIVVSPNRHNYSTLKWSTSTSSEI